MTQTLIKNALLVNEGQRFEGDLLIEQGRIARIGADIPAAGAEVYDAAGRLLMPGMIDDQVHFRDPGLTHKADLVSESRAAVAGGITSFMEMPNTNPQTVTLDALEAKYQRAAGRSHANFAFYLGGTNDNLEQIKRLRPDQTCGIKVFMGASTGNMLVDDPAILEAIFREAPMLIATHCEDTPSIQANEARYREQYGADIPMALHPRIRSAEACWKSSALAVELARRHDTRLHVLHITTARELAHFSPGQGDKRITAEACVHHLYFDEGDYAELGGLIKCNPAIKTRADRDGLRQALIDGRIDLIGTDHAPHTLAEKAGSYFNCPAGLPLVQHALPMALELYHDGLIALELLLDKLTHSPARLFDLAERGYLREGYWADLALVDLNAEDRVERERLLYKCGWSPLEGRRLRSRIAATWVNGLQVYDGEQVAQQANGQRLKFQRQP
ncbi:MAG: dihydroorotase [Gammaproteobacteria bacterium SHHR-1]|uniref:dihydroorotase n=1 Tax=Magnetovirga frankeli TaxID=947516 RepID=UPI00129369D4|nr:dihydroorotase [gamma proteobacterium SS-5]